MMVARGVNQLVFNQSGHLETVFGVSEFVIVSAMGHPLFVESFFATIVKR